MVPEPLRRLVLTAYRRGQCDDMAPSLEWHKAADAAIGAVALLGGCPTGKLRVVMVRALLDLYPSIFGEAEKNVRFILESRDKEIAELDRFNKQ